jgi:hypothetical protein
MRSASYERNQDISFPGKLYLFFSFKYFMETVLYFWPPLWARSNRFSGYRFRGLGLIPGAMGLERGPLSPASTIEELLERKSSGHGLGNREYGRRDPSLWLRDTLYSQKLALTSPTSSGGSVGTVRSRTQATEFLYYIFAVKLPFTNKKRAEFIYWFSFTDSCICINTYIYIYIHRHHHFKGYAMAAV